MGRSFSANFQTSAVIISDTRGKTPALYWAAQIHVVSTIMEMWLAGYAKTQLRCSGGHPAHTQKEGIGFRIRERWKLEKHMKLGNHLNQRRKRGRSERQHFLLQSKKIRSKRFQLKKFRVKEFQWRSYGRMSFSSLCTRLSYTWKDLGRQRQYFGPQQSSFLSEFHQKDFFH